MKREYVCEWRERIVGIKTPNMIASGILIRISDFTNRHVVEDINLFYKEF